MKLTRLERSWLPVLFSAFVDPDADGVAATHEAVRFEEAVATILRAASFKGALGWRVGALVLMLSPLLLAGRFAVSSEDIAAVAPAVLRHRVIPTYEADAEGLSSDKLVARLLETIPIP